MFLPSKNSEASDITSLKVCDARLVFMPHKRMFRPGGCGKRLPIRFLCPFPYFVRVHEFLLSLIWEVGDFSTVVYRLRRVSTGGMGVDNVRQTIS